MNLRLANLNVNAIYACAMLLARQMMPTADVYWQLQQNQTCK